MRRVALDKKCHPILSRILPRLIHTLACGSIRPWASRVPDAVAAAVATAVNATDDADAARAADTSGSASAATSPTPAPTATPGTTATTYCL